MRAPPVLARMASSIDSLAKRIRRSNPEITPRDPWKEQHVGSTVNLKQSRAHEKHKGLRTKLTARVARRKAKPKANDDDEGSLKSHAEVTSDAEELLARADGWDERIPTLSTFPEQFAERVVAAHSSADDIMSAWDTSGDGKISVAEFRLRVRGLGFKSEQVTVFEIDELFRSLDLNGSAFLHLNELKTAFERMQAGVARHMEQVKRAVDAAARLREAAAVAVRAAKRTATLDAQEYRMELRQRGKLASVEQMLGKLMAQRNVRLHDVGRDWAERVGFRRSVRVFGVGDADTDDAALDALFDSFGPDERGALGVPQLKAALGRLQTAAAVAAADDADQVIVVSEVRAEVRKAQVEADRAAAQLDGLREEEARAERGGSEEAREVAELKALFGRGSTPRRSTPRRSAASGSCSPPPSVRQSVTGGAGGGGAGGARERLVQPPWKSVNAP